MNRRRVRSSSDALLGLAMGLSNALSYVFVLVLTRALGAESFGAYSALTTVGIVLAIPAGAFQVIVGRRWPDPSARTSGVLAAGVTGFVLTMVTLGAAPVLDGMLHLGSPAPAAVMALMLVPMTVTGAFQGILLGSGRLVELSKLYVVTATSRLVAAFGCAVVRASLTEVFLAMVVASVLAAGYGWWRCRDLLGRTAVHSSSLLAEMLRSNSTLAAFTALTNVDVVLVRHFLDAHTSGGYGLASTFGRAMCWGTQFVALVVVPRVATGSRTVLWRAAGLVTALGVAATATAALAPGTLARVVGGPEFADFGGLVVACLGLGTLWALTQLWLFSEMAGDDAALGSLAWVMVAVEVGVGWWWVHGSALAVVGLAACCSAVVVVAGVWLTRRRPVRHLEDRSVLLATDST